MLVRILAIVLSIAGGMGRESPRFHETNFITQFSLQDHREHEKSQDRAFDVLMRALTA